MDITGYLATIFGMLVIWGVSIYLVRDFVNSVLKVKKHIWLWRVLVYTPIINTIALILLLIFSIGVMCLPIILGVLSFFKTEPGEV